MICKLIAIASRPYYGRTKPVRVMVETPDGSEFEVYLKAPHLGEKPFPCLLEREWSAGRLAQQLHLPCATPLMIHLEPDVVATVQDMTLRTRLQAGPEILFGSLSGGPGWIEWSDAMSVSRNHIQLAAEIYLFDTIIQNWDRCAPNPNLLVKGEKFLMIDHGEAFVGVTGSEAERDHHSLPWKVGGVENHVGEYEMHPLWPKLRPKDQIDFTIAADRWKALPDDVFTLIAADVPDCWNKVRSSRIAAYLAEAVKNVDAIVANIEYNFER